MSEFRWHKMADEQPTYENAFYVLLGKRGAMYLADSFNVRPNGSKCFYIPNNRSGFMEFEKVKAWAEIPKYGGAE